MQSQNIFTESEEMERKAKQDMEDLLNMPFEDSKRVFLDRWRAEYMYTGKIPDLMRKMCKHHKISKTKARAILEDFDGFDPSLVGN